MPMKATDSIQLQADPVLAELRETKTQLAAVHHYDARAMVKSLQEREKVLYPPIPAPAKDR